MQLFPTTDDTTSILAFDIFQLLGTTSMPEEQKQDYIDNLTKLIMEYFLQEKVGDRLTADQIQDLMSKYPPDSDQNIQGFFQAIGELLPDAPDLLTEASTEVKARLVRDQYTKMRENYRQKLKVATSDLVKTDLEYKIKDCEDKLSLIDSQQWGKLAKITQKQ